MAGPPQALYVWLAPSAWLPDAVPVKSYVIGAAAALFIMPPIAPATSASITAERVFIALPDRIVLRENVCN
jgi:hypothetical protein